MHSIVITGASTGIGRACVERFHDLGWQVFAGVRKGGDAEALRSDTVPKVVPTLLDVTRQEMIDEAAALVGRAVGDGGLQGLVNNAGIGIGGPVEALRIEDLRKQFEVNLFGQVAVSQAFLPLLRAAGGRIVNMSSVAGKVAQPFMAPYCGSKHALEALTDAMREELAPWGIHVAAVEPGVIRTPIWEKAGNQLAETRKTLSAEVAEHYRDALERVETVLQKLPERGIPPERVAAAVEHAMTSERPRTRYPVGRDAKMGIFLRRLLGDRAFYRLMKRLARRR